MYHLNWYNLGGDSMCKDNTGFVQLPLAAYHDLFDRAERHEKVIKDTQIACAERIGEAMKSCDATIQEVRETIRLEMQDEVDKYAALCEEYKERAEKAVASLKAENIRISAFGTEVYAEIDISSFAEEFQKALSAKYPGIILNVHSLKSLTAWAIGDLKDYKAPEEQNNQDSTDSSGEVF